MAYEQFAGYYDRLMEHMPYESWLLFLEQCFDKYGKPRTIVDLGCGTGTIAIPLAEQGYEVTGIDLSPSMLAVATEKARKSGVNVRWLEQNMCEWEVHAPVDAVISVCDCMNYVVEQDEIIATMKATWKQLRDGGLFIFDVLTYAQFEQYADEQPFVWNEDDLAYMWTCEYDQIRGQIEHSLTIFAHESLLCAQEAVQTGRCEGRFVRIDELHVQRAYPVPWLEKQLRTIGFRDVELLSEFGMGPVDEQTLRLFVIARK